MNNYYNLNKLIKGKKYEQNFNMFFNLLLYVLRLSRNKL